jgi:hypothetical protein
MLMSDVGLALPASVNLMRCPPGGVCSPRGPGSSGEPRRVLRCRWKPNLKKNETTSRLRTWRERWAEDTIGNYTKCGWTRAAPWRGNNARYARPQSSEGDRAGQRLRRALTPHYPTRSCLAVGAAGEDRKPPRPAENPCEHRSPPGHRNRRMYCDRSWFVVTWVLARGRVTLWFCWSE